MGLLQWLPSFMANGDSLALCLFVGWWWGMSLETWQRLACLYPSTPPPPALEGLAELTRAHTVLHALQFPPLACGPSASAAWCAAHPSVWGLVPLVTVTLLFPVASFLSSHLIGCCSNRVSGSVKLLPRHRWVGALPPHHCSLHSFSSLNLP